MNEGGCRTRYQRASVLSVYLCRGFSVQSRCLMNGSRVVLLSRVVCFLVLFIGEQYTAPVYPSTAHRPSITTLPFVTHKQPTFTLLATGFSNMSCCSRLSVRPCCTTPYYHSTLPAGLVGLATCCLLCASSSIGYSAPPLT